MSGTLAEVYAGTYWPYAPLPAAAMKRILAFDRERGFGPGGTMPNRNRFYTYLTQRGSDVQVRTVAVKAPRCNKEPVAKEVARASVDDRWIHVLDLGFTPICGYVVVVDWGQQGFCDRGWDYRGRWHPEAYGLRCNWKINAPVINPELLKRTKRFRWSDWQTASGHILDYLKVFSEHPEIELLQKAGLGCYCTRISLVRKLKKDRAFRQFFMQHTDELRQKSRYVTVAVILRAYGKGISFAQALHEIDVRHSWRGYNLPREIDALKARRYVDGQKTGRNDYSKYIHNCQTLGLNLVDTKVCFPKQFKRRAQVLQDQIDTIRAEEEAQRNKAKAKSRRQMPIKLAEIADRFQWLEGKSTRTFRIVVPRTIKQFSAEGKAMSNCLGDGYAARMARGESLIVFVRRAEHPRTAFVAVEYDLKQNRVAQCYGVKNSPPSKPVKAFVERVFSKASTKQLKVAA